MRDHWLSRFCLRTIAIGRALGRELDANAAVTFGLALPVIFGAVGVAIDYSSAASMRSKMQAVADAAAIAAAREMQMAQSSVDRLIAIVDSYVQSQLNGVASKTVVDFTKYTVQVDLRRDYQMTIGKVVSAAANSIARNCNRSIERGTSALLGWRWTRARPEPSRCRRTRASRRPRARSTPTRSTRRGWSPRTTPSCAPAISARPAARSSRPTPTTRRSL